MARSSVTRRKATASLAVPNLSEYAKELAAIRYDLWNQLHAFRCVYRTVEGVENDQTIGASVTVGHLEDLAAARAVLAVTLPGLQAISSRVTELGSTFCGLLQGGAA